MKSFKKASLFTALLALILGVTITTSYAQSQQEADTTAAFTLKGEVVDAETSQAVADAEVTIVGKDISATTDQEGKFKLQNLPAGAHTVTVEVDGYQSWEKNLTLDKDAELTIELEPVAQQ